jgi:hypothetical protein
MYSVARLKDLKEAQIVPDLSGALSTISVWNFLVKRLKTFTTIISYIDLLPTVAHSFQQYFA